jgi:hypothetical protein
MQWLNEFWDKMIISHNAQWDLFIHGLPLYIPLMVVALVLLYWVYKNK